MNSLLITQGHYGPFLEVHILALNTGEVKYGEATGTAVQAARIKSASEVKWPAVP
jgi:hypothetical protein